MLTAKIDMGDKVFPALPVVLPLSEVRMTCIDNERITNMVEGHLRKHPELTGLHFNPVPGKSRRHTNQSGVDPIITDALYQYRKREGGENRW